LENAALPYNFSAREGFQLHRLGAASKRGSQRIEKSRKQEVFYAIFPSDAREVHTRDVAGAVSLCDPRFVVGGSFD
jgi:hypothetical protein